ncbi:MAG TPA: crosslink repair DNA glycosylase YcaQ family protein, partial [Candidatus Limnocylindria bacterium]|nr:crosslink repair DNA glycosylase YcaQ family protein [Candidatus Limnocylindria bacterium]
FPAPVRFLPVYDNVTLAHADRSRIVDDHHRKRLLTLDIISFGSILVGGLGRAIWRVERDRAKQAAVLDVALLEDLGGHEIDEIGAEGEQLLAYLEPDATLREIRIRRLSTA